MDKVELADKVSQRVTEGDQGQSALQAVADALSKALAATPFHTRGSEVPQPYMDLARLARYEHVAVSLDDPLYKKANDILAANEAEIAKADFTLEDLNGKKWTLSELRGKIVLVNFWATWCPPCRAEMPNLDALYTQYANQGLVILSITDENPSKVDSFLQGKDYHPPVLIDSDRVVNNEFHVEGIPQTFVFDRDGKLTGIAIDQSTPQQFLPCSPRPACNRNKLSQAEAQIRRTLCSIVLITLSMSPDSTCFAMLSVKPFAVWNGTCDGSESARQSTTASTTTGPSL